MIAIHGHLIVGGVYVDDYQAGATDTGDSVRRIWPASGRNAAPDDPSKRRVDAAAVDPSEPAVIGARKIHRRVETGWKFDLNASRWRTDGIDRIGSPPLGIQSVDSSKVDRISYVEPVN